MFYKGIKTMMRGVSQFIVVLILVDITTSFIFNGSLLDDFDNKLETLKTRRRKSQSTSSDTGRRSSGKGDKDDSKESLELDFTDSSTSTSDEKKPRKKDRTPKSTQERKGWRKWHRKCPKCPEDMHKKWRDPSIKWICGAYQRARRTFKSLCMMHYRNCQDGTMFTKIADHRCPNASGQVHPYGRHFFYDYAVEITDDETASSDESEEPESESSSSSWSSGRKATIPHFI